ncbi:hypothetical protein [Amycolatopsis sp. lyj-23]|uniref:hypothetical protein n=1 Tax=Amycolatopsis sp. lyj-23 TaxID=2789283 RepID=UPI003978339D
MPPGTPVSNLDLAGDRVPTMFIAGRRDPVVAPAHLDQLNATLPAADATGISVYRSTCPL